MLLPDTGLGQKTGLITSWGGGAFGFMRSLALLGPLTVPQIAEMRPTSRQRMQRLADELAAEGLVEFVDNPKHRRSKLVQLTRKGEARYGELECPAPGDRLDHGRRARRGGYPQDHRGGAAAERGREGAVRTVA